MASLFFSYALRGLNRFKMIINGIEYIERPVSKGHTRMSAYIGAMIMMFGGIKSKNKPLPTYNVVYEFALIQQKKSNLSRSEREQVVREFNKHFMPKPNEED